jgi:SsrA-binding protein
MQEIIKNRKAYFEYHIVETYIAGIQLLGCEVKSIRNMSVSIAEAYCHIVDNEIFIKNMHISEFKQQNKYVNHEPLRDKKLLLKKKEIDKLSKMIKKDGLTLIPISIKISDRGLIKLEIGLGKGKKSYDKRASIKEKDIKRELSKEI